MKHSSLLFQVPTLVYLVLYRNIESKKHTLEHCKRSVVSPSRFQTNIKSYIFQENIVLKCSQGQVIALYGLQKKQKKHCICNLSIIFSSEQLT